MSNFEMFIQLISMRPIQNLIIVGVLIALCCSLFGTTLVLKRFSFIGDGLSHVAFGATVVAALVGLTNDMLITMPITIVCAIILLCTGQKAKVKGDAAVAMISVSALAIGYLIMDTAHPTGANISSDVCASLFGQGTLFALTEADLLTSIILSVVVTAIFLLFYHRIFAITFDENFARATGTKAGAYNIVMAIVIAVVIVLAMNVVGSLLISALIVFPTLSSMRVFKSFRSVIISSSILAITGTLLGILASLLFDTTCGSTIVATYIAIFVCFVIAGIIIKHRKSIAKIFRRRKNEVEN